MKTMFQVLCDSNFRISLMNELRRHNMHYIMPQIVPSLYRYSNFSKYAIENLENNGFSLSIISSFNDSFDSTISFGDIENRATLLTNNRIPIRLSDSKEMLYQFQDAHRYFTSTSHCMCLSESNDSVLMWSHYAGNQKGICTEYNFNSIRYDLLYYCLFPVCYTEKPIDVYNLLFEKNDNYSIEMGVLISTLNKAKAWEYEKEWRLVILDEDVGNNNPIDIYLPIYNTIKAKQVTLGCKFLDNFFQEYPSNLPQGEMLDLLKRLCVYVNKSRIPLTVMRPVQNSFSFKPKTIIDVDALYRFFEIRVRNREFELRRRQNIYLEFEEEFFANY